MTYKYPFMRRIAEKIRDGTIPEDLDIEEVINFYIKNKNLKSKKVVGWKNKPRFYNRALSANNRARKLGKKGLVSWQELEEVFSAYNGKCANRRTEKDIVFDHIVSLYRGGEHIKNNLQLLCRVCNMEKGVNQ